MSKEVHWLLELKVNSGKLNDFKTVMAEMIAATMKEGGTLAYEWCFSDDESVCNIYERYVDSDAVMTHLGSFANFAERFLAAVTPTKFTVLGHPNATAKAALAGFSPPKLDSRSLAKLMRSLGLPDWVIHVVSAMCASRLLVYS